LDRAGECTLDRAGMLLNLVVDVLEMLIKSHLIANFFFGYSSMIVSAMATTVLTEFMLKRASKGIAVNNFVRNTFSCVGGIVAYPIIPAIGKQWMCTVLGLLALLIGCIVIWSMNRFGPKWREEMDKKVED
jgi:Na+-translocating ferredoxin:NAD+ oxidoreductase RnfD subunit